MMDLIYKPLGWVLEFCSTIVGGNYLIAILIFAIFVEIILLPFGIKQQKNSIKQARLRPKEMAIRKKYAGRTDKPTQQKMNQEVQELYQKEGYNPMSGCLPLLIQFPLLMALYQVVVNPLQYICGLSSTAVGQISIILDTNSTQSMALLTRIKEMGYEPFRNVEGFTEEVYNSMPDLNIFGVFDLSIAPSECMNSTALSTVSGWLILSIPVLTFLAYFFSMRMTRKLSYQPMADGQKAGGCSNKVMDIVMPLLSVFICFSVPAALGIYWIFKSFLGVAKQAALYYAMPLPKFTEEDYKAAEKEVGVRTDRGGSVKKSGKAVRSLHHIDDEDFEDTAEKARLHKDALDEQEAQNSAPVAKKGILDAAPLKTDDRKTAESKKKESEDEDTTDEE